MQTFCSASMVRALMLIVHTSNIGNCQRCACSYCFIHRIYYDIRPTKVSSGGSGMASMVRSRADSTIYLTLIGFFYLVFTIFILFNRVLNGTHAYQLQFATIDNY